MAQSSDSNSTSQNVDRQLLRRRLLKTGALLIPAIVTLRARSALATPPDGSKNNPLPVLNPDYTGGDFGIAGIDYKSEYGGARGSTFDVWGVDEKIDHSGKTLYVDDKGTPGANDDVYYTFRQ